MTLYHFKSDLLIWALFDAYEVPQLPSENRIVQNPEALRITVAFLIKTEEEIK